MHIPKHILDVLTNNKITDYLYKKGITPEKKYADKWTYICPVHRDGDPSFVVYLESEESKYQNYYCFGCHSAGTIINLKSDIEKTKTSEIFKDFLKNVDINYSSILHDNIEIILDSLSNNNIIEIEMLLLKISNICYTYLESINFDKDEFLFFENIYKIVDSYAIDKNIGALEESLNFLVTEGIESRKIKFLNVE